MVGVSSGEVKLFEDEQITNKSAPRTAKEKSPSLDWASIQPQLDAAECDVLIILDCCYAGQAVRARNRHYVEILAATDKDQMTPIGLQKWPSFTKVLMNKMMETMERQQEINIRELHYQLAQASAGLRKQPFYASSTVKSTGHIILKKLHSTKTLSGPGLIKPMPTYNTEKESPLFLEVYAHRPLDSTVLDSIMSWLTKDSPSSIVDVRLAKQTVTDASSFQSIGTHILEKFENNDRGRPWVQSHHRDELTERLLHLQRTLHAPSPLELTDNEAEQLVGILREKSQSIDVMIQDLLATLKQSQLQELQSHQDITDNEQIRNRIQMRLAVLSNEDNFKAQPLFVEFIDQPKKDERFRLGAQRGRQVLVEYWYYDEHQKNAFERACEHACRMSALLLEPKPDAFRSLPGIGYLHEHLHGPRFGFIYELPDVQNVGTYAVVSEVIKQVGYVPLEHRIRMCSVLCEAMLQLHSVGWYHKALHSGNVLLFGNENRSESRDNSTPIYNLENPYVIGFDCSRPSEAETRQTVDFTFKDNLYRHPDRWGKPASFRSYHDIYSFVSQPFAYSNIQFPLRFIQGILLLEIGCWRTLTQMDNRKKGFEYIKDPEVLREYLLSKALNLVAHYAGSDFASAVRACLEKRDWERLDEWQIQQTIREEVLARLKTFS
jgi:hypothetical protein